MSDIDQRRADWAERLLLEFGERLSTDDVDLDRLHAVVHGAIVHHPDRENIESLVRAGAVPFVAPLRGDAFAFELRIGYFEDASLNPPGAPAGRTWKLGEILYSHIVRRPQG